MTEKTKEAYVCSTCGKTASHKGHLCSPTEKRFACEYCGAKGVDTRHVCYPKVESMRYVCETCGRVAVNRTHVCNPRRIPKTSVRMGEGAKTATEARKSPE
jgi:DNA-directed RNA polymerase subunit RPC12/RpoP